MVPRSSRSSAHLASVTVSLLLLGLSVCHCARDPQRAPRPTGEQAAQGSTGGPSLSDHEVYRRFLRRFHDQVYAVRQNRTKWLGIETLQNPNDAWVHQEIIYEVKPDFIVETGTYQGGSAILWAMLLEQANPAGKVITVDIVDHCQRARRRPIWQERIIFLQGSSTDPQIVDAIKQEVENARVLVILDSDHSKPHVLQEMKLYAPLVAKDSYLIVQDTFYDYPPPFHPQEGPGPWGAVQDFLATNRDFQIDASRGRLLLTFNPSGYLKRVN
jgi:cephalosporin hydroxylase